MDWANVAQTQGFVAFFINNGLTVRAGTGAGAVDATTRVFTATDVNKFIRLVWVLDVANLETSIYTNGIRAGFSVINAYAPGTAQEQTLFDFGGAGGAAMTSAFDLIDCAMLNGVALNVQDVLDLDTALLAAGKIPDDFVQWQMLMRMDELRANTGTLNAGGLSGGTALQREGTPVLGSFDQYPPGAWGPAL
jgi:hypothetical protein